MLPVKKLLRTAGVPAFVLAVLCGALWLLHQQLRQYQLQDFLSSLQQIPYSRLALATGLTILNYVILIGYDYLGVKYTGHALPLRKVAVGSFVGYTLANNFGAILGGSTVRYRLYSSWGLSALDIVRLIVILSLTFWIGLFGLAGVIFVIEPLPLPPQIPIGMSSTRPLGIALLITTIVYLLICAVWHRRLRILGWDFTPPHLRLAVPQLAVATLDLIVAAGVLYVLLPASIEVSYWYFLGIYLLTLVAALLTHVPGGLGILELIMVVLLHPRQPELVVGALVAFRAIYYLLPLSIGLAVLAWHELSRHGERTVRSLDAWGRWLPVVAPRILGLAVFVCGIILLASGATPTKTGRLGTLGGFGPAPLPVIETSHFSASVTGVLLLILARGLQRRLAMAFRLTIGLLLAGIAFSLLKGWDYEEAIMLGLMLLIFIPAREFFHRRAALLSEPLTLARCTTIIAALVCTLWLMFFAYRHVDYRHELWWQFTLDGHAPRSLRAIVGASMVLLIAASSRLLRPGRPPVQLPLASDLAAAAQIAATARSTASHLALLGDKYLLFNARRNAMIMYGTQGSSYVAMGDPLGPADEATDLAWDFCELCDAAGTWPVFYQVSEGTLPLYIDLGLSLIKIGEEARVELADFQLEGRQHRSLRHTCRAVAHAKCEFAVVPVAEVAQLLPELKRVSDAWLAAKHAAEKGFSLGFFRDDYLARFPLAVVRHEGRLVAFANLWLGAEQEEVSVDLMRHTPQAPHGVMDFLFAQIMLWGKAQGYAWFNLGMAPLSGIDDASLGPAWNKLAALTFRHGEHFYHFRGLRQYKEKFDPVWSSRFLAYPGPTKLPIVLANIVTLIGRRSDNSQRHQEPHAVPAPTSHPSAR